MSDSPSAEGNPDISDRGKAGKPRPQIPDHEMLRPIGGGSFGEVWLAKNVMGGFRAVKVVYRATFESDRPYEREFNGIKKFEPISRSHEGFVDILRLAATIRRSIFIASWSWRTMRRSRHGAME